MPTEIELKLLIEPAATRRLQLHPLLRRAARHSSQILDNWYFDTPELEVRRHGIALRVRRQGRQKLQTIKLASKRLPGAATGGLSIRPEWETPYRGRFDFSVIGIPEIVAWLEDPHISMRIGPLFRTRFRRVTWVLPLATGGEVLAALDRGAVTCGPHSQPICELELELAGSKDHTQLQRIAADLGTRVALTPSDLSKAQRGYDLLALREPPQ